MTSPVRLDLDAADTVRALDAAFRRADDVRRAELRVKLGRILGRARSAQTRARTDAVRVRWAAVEAAAVEAIEGWRLGT